MSKAIVAIDIKIDHRFNESNETDPLVERIRKSKFEY